MVHFDVRVPSGVGFVGRTVNGEVNAESLQSDAEAHTVNGSVRLTTSGLAVASTVNGSASLEGVHPGERVLLRAAFDDASVHAFRMADAIAAILVVSGGVIALAGIRNPRRIVAAELCPAGALCGASQELAATGQSRI